MQNYLSEYAQMILDKHGKGSLAKMSDAQLRGVVVSELGAFGPDTGEIVGVTLELRTLVGDDAPPHVPARKRGHDAMFM